MAGQYLFSELEKAFNFFNLQLFSKKLRIPAFSFQPDKKYLFRFEPSSYQIIIGRDIIVANEVELLAELLHEIIHIYNFNRNIVDCRNQYHNDYFLKIALDLGFYVVKHKTKGWSVTSLTLPKGMGKEVEVCPPEQKTNEKLQEVIKSIKLNKIVLNKMKQDVGQSTKKRRNTIFFLKYECACPAPHNSIRSGRRPDGKKPLKIRCLYCNSEFKCVDT